MADETNKPIEDIDDLSIPANASDEELNALFASAATTPVIETPEPVTPENEPDPEGQQADPDAGLPSWLKNVPADDRDTMLTSWLSSLPQDKLASLAPVNGLLTQAQIDGAAAGAAEVEDAFTRHATEQAVQQSALALARDLEPFVQEAGIDVNARLTEYGGVYGLAYARQQLGKGIAEAFNTVNLSVPEDVMRLADQNGKKGGPGMAAATYAVWGMQTAFAAGEAQGISKSATDQKADMAAQKAIWRQEFEAELAAEGRLKSAVPPPMGGGDSLGGGAGSQEIGENAGLDELFAAAQANVAAMRAVSKR